MPPSPTSLAAHRRVLIPLFGAIATARQLAAATDAADRAVLTQASKWQSFGAYVVLMHAVIQAGIELTRFMHGLSGGLGQPLDSLFGPVLLACSVLNIGSGLAEYAFVVFWGLRAARGHPMPFFRATTASAPDGLPGRPRTFVRGLTTRSAAPPDPPRTPPGMGSRGERVELARMVRRGRENPHRRSP